MEVPDCKTRMEGRKILRKGGKPFADLVGKYGGEGQDEGPAPASDEGSKLLEEAIAPLEEAYAKLLAMCRPELKGHEDKALTLLTQFGGLHGVLGRTVYEIIMGEAPVQITAADLRSFKSP